MRGNIRFPTFFLFLICAFLPLNDLCAEIFVHDTVAVKGKPLMLTAETGKAFFPKGGEMVEFFVEGESIGGSLSGGDGFAYREFIPSRKGLYRIKVKSMDTEAEGLLLSLEKGDGVVFIDAEGGIGNAPFLIKHREGSRKAIKRISERFPIVYLHTGALGMSIIKKRLKGYGFPEAPLVPWRAGDIFDEIGESGINIKAVIGGPSVIESAREYKPKSFSFEEVEGAKEVEGWEEIPKEIQ